SPASPRGFAKSHSPTTRRTNRRRRRAPAPPGRKPAGYRGRRPARHANKRPPEPQAPAARQSRRFAASKKLSRARPSALPMKILPIESISRQIILNCNIVKQAASSEASAATNFPSLIGEPAHAQHQPLYRSWLHGRRRQSLRRRQGRESQRRDQPRLDRPKIRRKERGDRLGDRHHFERENRQMGRGKRQERRSRLRRMPLRGAQLREGRQNDLHHGHRRQRLRSTGALPGRS